MQKKIKSKLEHVGISIFTEMSTLANHHGAINLSQGFPEFDTPEFLKSAVNQAIEQGLNQYAPSVGMPVLLTALANLLKQQYGVSIDPQQCITVTSGATEAIWVAVQAIVGAGDEVIVFDPAYDSYEPSIEMAGGQCVHIPLRAPDYRIDWNLVSKTITSKTRAIMINSPHNPTGTLLSQEDMLSLQEIVVDNELLLISDEVYEFITFDASQHQSVLSYSQLAERAFVISSFGKTFHTTGWKVGYCTAPDILSYEFRKIHQFVTFSTNTPAQVGIAKMLSEQPEYIDELGSFYQRKRDLLIEGLSNSRFEVLPCYGTYFVLVDYSQVSQLNDREFCHWLVENVGVAAIPLSPFYQKPTSDSIVRLCFAKNDDTLLMAAEKLCQL